MTIAAGDLLGPYEVLDRLGAGGMGEVFRARDTRLGREVAVKVLPPEVAGDADRLRRFEQEARAASALNHPGILTVHDCGNVDGTAYLVTELLSGQSLRERLREGPLSPKAVARFGMQVARALATAHDRGIVHRDLKPDNLFITAEGAAKILDFGLARMECGGLLGAESDDTPTVAATESGVLLGTVGYMAPEQARGQRADASSDLFAVGVVLHEALSGTNPFRRDSAVETLNAILKEDAPDLDGAIGAGLSRVVGRLLEKEPARRFRSAHDLAFALEALGEASSGDRLAVPVAAPAPRFASRWLMPAVGLMVLAVGVAVGWTVARGAGAAAGRPVAFQIQPPDEGGFSVGPELHGLALSPDGTVLAYVATTGGAPAIWLRDLGDLAPTLLQGTEGAYSPFWSPDGRSLAFFAMGRLKRIDRAGGPARILCEVSGTNSGSWGSRGEIVFTQNFGPDNGLFRVSADGGQPQRILHTDGTGRWAEFLPGGDSILYWDRQPGLFDGQTYRLDLETGVTTRLEGITSQARYADPGWLVHVSAGSLVAQRFDAEAGELVGSALPLAAGVSHFLNGFASFTVAGNQVLAYQTDSRPAPLMWYDRHGREIGRVGPPARYVAVRLAPDGSRAVATRQDPETAYSDLWIIDLEHGGATRLTSEPYLEYAPVWSPEGEYVAYMASSVGPQFAVTIRRVEDGAVQAGLAPQPYFRFPRGWSGDGILIDESDPRTGNNLVSWSGTGQPEPESLLSTDFDERFGVPSPDGAWIAFLSSEAGRTEIQVMPRAAVGRRRPVSHGALAFVPRWRADGRELFYVSSEGWLTAVTIEPGDEVEVGDPVALFPVALSIEDGFDVTADGQRFLIASALPGSNLPVTVVLGWQALLPAR